MAVRCRIYLNRIVSYTNRLEYSKRRNRAKCALPHGAHLAPQLLPDMIDDGFDGDSHDPCLPSCIEVHEEAGVEASVLNC